MHQSFPERATMTVDFAKHLLWDFQQAECRKTINCLDGEEVASQLAAFGLTVTIDESAKVRPNGEMLDEWRMTTAYFNRGSDLYQIRPSADGVEATVVLIDESDGSELVIFHTCTHLFLEMMLTAFGDD